MIIHDSISRHRPGLGLRVFAALRLLAGAAGAAVKTGDGGAGTVNWADANNWNPNGVPTSGDAVWRDNRGTNPLPQINALSGADAATLGVRPPGGCHFPLTGWAEFARMAQPLLEHDHYGKASPVPLTAPNLRRAAYASSAKDALTLEFDQPVVWTDTLAGQFYLDGAKDKVAAGSVAGNVLTLKLKEPVAAKQITYLKEIAWSQDTLLVGANGLAALTFCEVPIAARNTAQ